MVPQKCVKNLSNKDFANLSKDGIYWSCYDCKLKIFPFFQLNDHDFYFAGKSLNDEMAALIFYGTCRCIEGRQTRCTHCVVKDIHHFSVDMFDFKNCNFDHLDDIDPFKNLPSSIESKYIKVDNLSQPEQTATFSLLSLNIRSVRKNFKSLRQMLVQSKIKHDIIAISETWLDKTCEIDDYVLAGYCEPVVQNRGIRGGGGVMMYFSDRVECYRELSEHSYVDEYNNILTVEYTVGGKKQIITLCYRSPDTSNNSFYKKFKCISEKISTKNSVICGDFNYNLINCAQHKETNAYFNHLITCGFLPTITKPTRITSSSATLIDHIWCNSMEIFDNKELVSNILIYDISDHLPTMLMYTVKNMKSNDKTKIQYRDYSNKNIQKFKDIFDNKLSDSIRNSLKGELKHSSTDEKFKLTFNKISDHYNNCFPLKTKTIHNKILNKPWITNDLQKKIKKRNKLYCKVIKTNNQNLKDKYKIIKNSLNSELRCAKVTYFKEKVTESGNDVRKKWDVIRTVINKTRKKNKTVPISSTELSKYFTNHPKELYKKIPEMRSKSPRKPVIREPDKLEKFNKLNTFRPVSCDEVFKILNDLNSNKGPGPDELSVKPFQCVAEKFSPILTSIFNSSIQEGVFPSDLKLAKCIPIHKGDDPLNPSNYRPISILNFTSKIFEKLLHTRLITYLDKNKLLYKNQYGYRKNHSTSHAVLNVTELIHTAISSNEYTIAMFLDLSKAFDTVDKNILTEKLYSYGLGENVIKLINNYMSERRMYIPNYCNKTNANNINNLDLGVPQGSTLGPLLFILYVNDIGDMISDTSKIIMYADDTTIIVTDKSLRNAEKQANIVMGSIYRYFCINKLSINVTKTKYMVFSPHARKKENLDCKILLNDMEVERVCVFKFLGVKIDENLNWEEHKLYICSKIRRNIGIIYKSRHILNYKDLLNMYNSFILPYLLYCLPAWGGSITSKSDPIIKMQNRIIRVMTFKSHTIDARDVVKNDILNINNLYKLEVAKVAYNFFNYTLPQPTNDIFKIISNKVNACETRGSSRLNLVRLFCKTTRDETRFYNKCTLIWNDIPYPIKLSLNKTKFIEKYVDFIKDKKF